MQKSNVTISTSVFGTEVLLQLYRTHKNNLISCNNLRYNYIHFRAGSSISFLFGA